MAKSKEPKAKRTKPTEAPRAGGSYDAKTGEVLERPPEHKAAERDESITDGQEEG